MAGVEPTSAGLEPAVRSAGLHPFEWLVIQLCVWPRNTKEPPPFGSGSSTNWTYVSPSYAVEGTSWGSVATQLKDWAFNIWAMARPRDVRRPLRPSECR